MNLRKASHVFRQFTFVALTLGASQGFAKPFAKDILQALTNQHPLQLTQLLAQTPKAFSFKGSIYEGDILLYAYRWLLMADDDIYRELIQLVQSMANLGLSAHAPIFLVHRPEHKEAIGAIIGTWTKIANEANPSDRDQTNLRSTMFLDALLSAGGLNVNAEVDMPLSNGTSYRIPISQWGLFIDGPHAIFEYFLSMGADPGAVNSLQMTAPMMLALHAKLGALQKFAVSSDPKRTALAFSHVEANANGYTALHYALLSVHGAKASVKDVLELLDFLSRHGTNPEPSDAAQTLMVTAKAMALRYPAHKKTYEKLILELPAILPQLRANYRQSRTWSCVRQLNSNPTAKH